MHSSENLQKRGKELLEITTLFSQKESGIDLSLTETWVDKIRLVRGCYSLQEEQQIVLPSDTDVIDLHFNLTGKAVLNASSIHAVIPSAQHSIFHHHNAGPVVTMYPTLQKTGNFFGASIPNSLFGKIIPNESKLLQQCLDSRSNQRNFWPGYSLAITPLIRSIIADMTITPYHGHMKRLYLEAKIIELFLAQVHHFDTGTRDTLAQLSSQDTDRLYEAKAYLDEQTDNYCSIVQLAGVIGINQNKLKQGFKQLFGNTVFGYWTDLKLSRARDLLLARSMNVGEAADLAGYKNQQHFTVAFKKKYGLRPSELLR